jgi:hypothetical protein
MRPTTLAWRIRKESGILTDGEIKSLVQDWHDRRTDEELDHVMVEMEMKAILCKPKF